MKFDRIVGHPAAPLPMNSASQSLPGCPTGAQFVVALALLWPLAACDTSSAESQPIRTYNKALAHYGDGEWDEAAEGFLEARQNAGQDSELRFRAALNLGLTYARKADGRAEENPQETISLLRHSAAWFRDAVERRPDDDQIRINLETVLRRIQILADQVNKGQNKLEARLDRVIEDQRGLRDQIRELMDQVADAGSASEPLAFQSEFDRLATHQRTLLADAGTISDFAGEELGLLESKAQADQSQLSESDQVRMVQLQNLEHYLQMARGNLADTRRLLRRLQGDKAHLRADAGLRDLKRAREQLLDPVTVLKSIAQDQALLFMHTGALFQLGKAEIRLDRENRENGESGAEDPAEPAATSAGSGAPTWLTDEHLRERQNGAEQRTGEVLGRFRTVAESRQAESGQAESPQDQSDPASAPPQASDPRQERVLEAAISAIPYLDRAVAAMQAASSAIAGQSLETAAARQNEALLALVSAIERFSGIRDLIELTYREHAETVALLTPPGSPDSPQSGASAQRPERAELTTEERAGRIGEAVAKNLDRLSRLDGLFADEIATVEAQAAQAKAAQAEATGDPNAPATPNTPGDQGAGDPAQAEAAAQQYKRAQELRRLAFDALTRLSEATASPARAGEALDIASQATTHIEELRRLFFSIIEHLKELLRNQTETHDKTGSASAAPEAELAGQLGPAVDAQKNHSAMGNALATALAEQADQAAASPDPNNPKAAEMAEKMGQAAEEVRAAAGQMDDAATLLAENLHSASSMSPDFAPALEAQQAAMEHLENAIRLLQPPQNQQQQNQEQDQGEQQQQQQEQQQEMSQQRAQRRLQEIRDREAERMRQKQKQQRHQPEPVEKDW
ncbi:MAG: hypothetical protein MJE77_10765 [Proteobacteria bacterium]|nr:hypothetical protein [Pseudomonadota bacterium]